MNTITETCPSLEDLAAFLEGKLSGDERARVVAHLADCPSCYEVFAEAARFQFEEEGEEEGDPPDLAEAPYETAMTVPARVIPFPVKKILPWAALIAAGLAIGVTTVPLYRQYNTMPEMTSAKLISPGLTGNAAEDTFWSEGKTRGPGASASFPTMSTEFLLGAHLVDLSLSLARNDEGAADDYLALINGHLEELGSRTADQAPFYKTMRVQLSDKAKPLRDFTEEAAKKEAGLAQTLADSPFLAFGKWAEAGRLSALAQDSSFFQDGAKRKVLRWFLWNKNREDIDLDPEVVTDLKQIKDLLDDSDPSSLPYEDLRKLFESILKHYQEESIESGLP